MRNQNLKALLMLVLYRDKFLCDLIYVKERLTNAPELDVWNLGSNEIGWAYSKTLSEVRCQSCH